MNGELFDNTPAPAGLQCVGNDMAKRRDFDGETYSKPRDGRRMGGQLGEVFALMCDGRRRTLAEIAQAVDGSEAGVSARLRDLRKTRFGSYTIDRERVGGGLWRYWMVTKCHRCGRDMQEVSGTVGNVTAGGKMWCGCPIPTKPEERPGESPGELSTRPAVPGDGAVGD